MPKKRKNDVVSCEFFNWILTRRDGVYYADGRSNTTPQGRHSLGTRNRDEAMRSLAELDRKMAVRANLAKPEILKPATSSKRIELLEGLQFYLKNAGHRVKRQSVVRYKTGLDNFVDFAKRKNIHYWDQITANFIFEYVEERVRAKKSRATINIEITTIKQLVKDLIESDLLPPEHKIKFKFKKPRGTTTYCWKPEEVAAMIAHCYSDPKLSWLGDILLALGCTGFRISELASLRWSDVDFKNNLIHLTDESGRAHQITDREIRQTKSGRDRSVPIHPELLIVLNQLPRSEDGVIFHGPRGNKLIPSTIREILIRRVIAPLESKFPHPKGEQGFRDGRLHSFRHYFCSTCIMNGVPERMVMGWLGHTSGEMVAKYFHQLAAESQKKMSAICFVNSAPNQSGMGG